MAADDIRDVDENRRLNMASNRLGGQDLRVRRDNVDTMSKGVLHDYCKRTLTDDVSSSGTPSFAKSKRLRARQILSDIQKDLDEAEKKRSVEGGEMTRMLVLLQKESDRRAEAEDRQRRAERDERLEAKRKEREDRDRLRREDIETFERRRLTEIQAARELREEQRRIDHERESRLDSEKEENRRRYEERLALDRTEARQRHE